MTATLPVRYPFGVSTSTPKSVSRDYPAATKPDQFKFANEDFTPYQSGQWTVTQTNGTVAALPWIGGVVKLSTAGTTNADTVNLASTAKCGRIQGQTRTWFKTAVAVQQTTVSDMNIYAGWSDNVNPASATNGILFKKAAGGTALSLLVIKGGTTTTFSNVGDLAEPSGLYGDANSSIGALTPNATGTTLTTLALTTPGAGYAQDPLVVIAGTAGSGAAGRVELGSGSLYNAVVTAAGSGYTAGTITAEIDHWVTLELVTDARGSLLVQINGVQVMALGVNGVTGIAAGGTTTVNTTGPSYTPSTTLTAGIMTNQPVAGDFINIAPLVEMYPCLGFTNTTANARLMYSHGISYAGDN